MLAVLVPAVLLGVLSHHCSVPRLRVRKHGKDKTKPHNFLVAATHLKALPSESGCRGVMRGMGGGGGKSVPSLTPCLLSWQRPRSCSEPWLIPVPCTRSPTCGA